MSKKRLIELYKKNLEHNITEGEQSELHGLRLKMPDYYTFLSKTIKKRTLSELNDLNYDFYKRHLKFRVGRNYYATAVFACLIFFSAFSFYLLQPEKVDEEHFFVAQNHPLVVKNQAVIITENEEITLNEDIDTTYVQSNYSILKTADKKVSFKANKLEWHTIKTDLGSQYQLQLADGSTIWLNGGSKVKYPTQFIGKERKIYVEGEVYCDIVKSTTPFLVAMPDERFIQVLGTKFNVRSYLDEHYKEITLIEGSVNYKVKNDTYRLVPDQQIYETNHSIQKKYVSAVSYGSWISDHVEFYGATLDRITNSFEKLYGIEIDIDKNLAGLTYTLSINKKTNFYENLEFFLKTSDLNYELRNGRIYIYKNH